VENNRRLIGSAFRSLLEYLQAVRRLEVSLPPPVYLLGLLAHLSLIHELRPQFRRHNSAL
jgi:hypothetical protein